MTTSPLEFSRIYGFVRSRQLDGTYPGDRATGVWPITSCRVSRGWGALLESEWAYPKTDDPWPPPEPPGADEKAKQFRILGYQPITDLYECKLAISNRLLVGASFQITHQWFEAKNGVIELPVKGDKIVGSHAVTLLGYSDKEERFIFANSWGRDWGDKGFGSLPYQYLEALLTEAWIRWGLGSKPPLPPKSGVVQIAWGIPDFAGRVFHAREFHDANSDERVGWAFAVQSQDYLAVHELYVRPQYRQRGYGTALLQSLRKLSSDVHLPLNFWITFADCKPENLSIVERLLGKEGYYLLESEYRAFPLIALPPVDLSTLSLDVPSPPALRLLRPQLGAGEPIPQRISERDYESKYQALAIDEATKPIVQRKDVLDHLDFVRRMSTQGEPPPITQEIAAQARQAWWDLWKATDFQLQVPAACTGPEGQMFYSWDRGRHHFELEIIPKEPAQFFYRDRETGVLWGEQYRVGAPLPTEAVQKLQLIIQANDAT